MRDTPSMREKPAVHASRSVLPFVTGLIVAAGLSACATPTPIACAAWPDYVSSTDMEEAATDVVVTDSPRASGTESMLGVDAAAYNVTVAEVEKGGIRMGTEIRVASTPDSCGSNFYPEGDQLDAPGPLRLYLLKNDQGTFQTLTPFDGVEPAA
jgi:hypothetical protein